MTFRLPDAPHAVPPIPEPRFRQRRDDLLGQERYGGRLFRHGVPRVRAGGADTTGLLKGTAKPPGSCKATILGDHEQPEEKGRGCWKPSVVFCRRLCGCSCPQWVPRLGYVRSAGPDARPATACSQAFSSTYRTAALDPSAVTGHLAACGPGRVMTRPGTGAPAWFRPGDSGSCPFVTDSGAKPAHASTLLTQTRRRCAASTHGNWVHLMRHGVHHDAF